MTLHILRPAHCDNPGCEVEWLPPAVDLTRTEVRAWLTERGWSCKRGRDLCPDCAAGRPTPHPAV